jgi:FMN phosphatase YigB (HAD superfamily)
MGERAEGRWEDVRVVTLAFRGSLVDWRSAVESILYETARRHGESPLDRGRALRERLGKLEAAAAGAAPGGRFAAAFQALARERGYRWAVDGDTALQRVVAGCRPHADVAPALDRAMRAGLTVVVVADADAAAVHAALRPLDGAIDDVVTAQDLGRARGPRAALACALWRAGVPAARALHVATGAEQLRAARSLGVRAAWLNRASAPPRSDAPFAIELRSLHGLADLAGRPAVPAG